VNSRISSVRVRVSPPCLVKVLTRPGKYLNSELGGRKE